MKIPGRVFIPYIRKVWRILCFAALFSLVLAGLTAFKPGTGTRPALARDAAFSDSAAQDRTNPGRQAQQREIIEKNARIRKLQEGIIDHKIKILGSKQKERTLLGELEKIEQQLQLKKKMIAELQAETAKQEVLLAEKQEYLNQVLAEKKAHQIHVKNRLSAYYRMGSVGLMNVLFSAESLPDLLDFQEYFGLMLQHDENIIQKYLAELQESNRAREEHAHEKLRLMQMSEEVRENEERLTRIKQEKNLLLKQVNTEQHLYEQAAQEIEDAASDLAATLQRLKSAEESRNAKRNSSPGKETEKKTSLPEAADSGRGFPAMKGRLSPPVAGTLLTRFGQKIEGKFGSTTVASGIDIKTGDGAPIQAVYDGRIIHSGYLRGYGNLIIIDHGQQYFSLISRAAEFYKNEGSSVTTGEIIGLTGEGDSLYGAGLHFEIRRGSTPEDPLLWLKKGALQAEAAPGRLP